MTSALKVAIVAAGVGTVAILGPLAGSAAAQPKFQYIGPKQCTNCHDHDNEKLWYEKKEIPEVHRLFPEQNNAGHINSLKQLDTPKSDEYAKAVGLADKYDAAGSCVACHGTVFGGEANAGVSCESCHGPGSGYKDPHQTKDSYEKSVKEFGMTKLIGNFAGWTQQCTNCHVMTDEKLIAAGHPSGDDFDLAKKFVPVSIHFKRKYEAADIADIARGEMQAVLRRRGRAPTATATPAPAADAAASSPAPAAAAAPTETPAATAAAPAASAPAQPPSTAAAAPAATPGAAAAAARPRPAARPAPIDPASPPAGSPTSIEPPAPADAAPATPPAGGPPPAAATLASTPAPAAVAVTTTMPGQYMWIGIGVVLLAIVIAGIVLVRKRK